jgi:hypothetical protein
MVVLDRLMKSTPLFEAVRLGEAFLELVCLYNNPSHMARYDLAETEARLNARRNLIQQGYEQFKTLKSDWPQLLSQVLKTPGLLSHCAIA